MRQYPNVTKVLWLQFGSTAIPNSSIAAINCHELWQPNIYNCGPELFMPSMRLFREIAPAEK